MICTEYACPMGLSWKAWLRSMPVPPVSMHPSIVNKVEAQVNQEA